MKRVHVLLVGLLIAFGVSLHAVQSTINVGSSANDGTGDTLRSAMQKVNSNFTELYGTIVNFNGNQFGTSSSTNVYIKSGATLTNSVLYGSTSGNWTVGSTGNFTSGSAGTIDTASGSLTLKTGGTTAATIDSSQYVGIGTSSPGYRLDVQNSATAVFRSKSTITNGATIASFTTSDDLGTAFVVYGPSYAGGTLFNVGAGGSSLTHSGNAQFAIGTSTANGILFGINSTVRGSFTSGGNLVVGSSTSETGLTGSGGLKITSATDSSSTTTGSAVFAGGIGVAKTLYVGTGVNVTGDVVLEKTITAAGTTGAQTINKNSGSVNFAAAATSLVVTCNKVTTSSVITATVASNDSTMKSVSVVAGSGSFTLYANAAPTAETRVNFRINN